jgi:CRAL/TRIO domain
MGIILFSIVNCLGKFYFINAPWGFATVWSVVKRWLDPVTVGKIAILGGSYQATLLEQIATENLPKQFGGSCTCEGGCELSDEGPWQNPEFLGLQNENVPKGE